VRDGTFLRGGSALSVLAGQVRQSGNQAVCYIFIVPYVACRTCRYGDIVRQTDPQCTGVCPKGYFCPIGTSYKYSYICGGWVTVQLLIALTRVEVTVLCYAMLCCARSNLYCPEGSINPLLVPQGFYSIGSESASSRFGVTICPPGYFCQEGLKWPCPVGRYTDVEGTIDSLCKDDCAPGMLPHSNCTIVLRSRTLSLPSLSLSLQATTALARRPLLSSTSAEVHLSFVLVEALSPSLFIVDSTATLLVLIKVLKGIGMD
jgi:hypothetical protein